MSTLSTRLAEYTSRVEFADLPPEVVDKAKAVLLHGLITGLASLDDPDVTIARRLVLEEAAQPDGGVRLLGFGDRTTRSAAGFFDSVLLHARAHDDSYRMLTHPGASVLPTACAEAEGRGIDGRRFLTAIVAGYEVHCRLARDVVPSVQNRGFRASAVFAIFGSAVASAKLRGLNAERFGHGLALAAAFASGSVETGRTGTREQVYQEPAAVQAGMLAARLAQAGATGAASCLDGPAGFFYSFTGSADGELTGSFEGATRTDLSAVADGLGERWELLDVTHKKYSGAGFIQPVVEAVTRLAREHRLSPANVRAIRIEMNLLETVHPSPLFPRPAWRTAGPGSTAQFAARALASAGLPIASERQGYGARSGAEADPIIQELASRVQVVAGDRRQYAPRVEIETSGGAIVSAELTGDEFKWDFATEREHVRALYPLLTVSTQRADEIADTVACLDTLPNVDALIDLTMPARG